MQDLELRKVVERLSKNQGELIDIVQRLTGVVETIQKRLIALEKQECNKKLEGKL